MQNKKSSMLCKNKVRVVCSSQRCQGYYTTQCRLSYFSSHQDFGKKELINFFFIHKLENQDNNYNFLLSIALSIYLTDREIILLRWRVVARKHQTVGQSKVFNTQIGKCQPILEENKRVE